MSAPRADVLGRPPGGGNYAYASITDKIADIVLSRPAGRGFWIALAVAGAVTALFVVAITYLFATGVGIWGVNEPVAWAFALTNFVWWVGIGHAGTFISAILLLVRQKWRTSINRFAEAMTIFAVAMAGLMPILHLGRPWFFYWLVPYPDVMNLWPQWRSPLVWDIFAIATYIIVSILFWYMGLLPDLATLRDRARAHGQRVVYGLLALGWRGDARHWHRFDTAYLLLAGLATPLVISVHTVVSLDFAIANLPGWHSTIFPPYFVAGALFSGFAMALTIAIPLRRIFRLEEFITPRHLANMAKLMLACGLIVAYSYAAETFTAFYSGDRFEIFSVLNRLRGPYAWIYWTVMFCNVAAPQALWWRWTRERPAALLVVSVVINVGMWLERFMIIVTSLHRDFLPSSWGYFVPTFWDWATLAGSLGTFALMFLLFVRFLPAISMSEMRKLEKEEGAAA
ncbi:MAG: NrfD/PsrC family molybdoenzyme membrane anchor subunit [Steroidobacteraceae bacterium]